jgi:hypothetical protein
MPEEAESIFRKPPVTTFFGFVDRQCDHSWSDITGSSSILYMAFPFFFFLRISLGRVRKTVCSFNRRQRTTQQCRNTYTRYFQRRIPVTKLSHLPLEASSCKVHVFHRTYTNHYYSVAGIETSSISTLPPESLLPREEMASHMTWQSFLPPHSIISNQFLLHPRVPRCHHVRTTGCDCEFPTRSSLGLALCPHPRPKSSPSCCRPLRVQACSSLLKCVSASRRRWVSGARASVRTRPSLRKPSG